MCQHEEEVLCPPEGLEDWGLITWANLPKTIDSKNVTFDRIREALLNPQGHKGCSVVKGRMNWTWGHFERVQEAPSGFPGNLLEGSGSGAWSFEPRVVSSVY